MHSALFRSISLRRLKFLHIKEGDLISGENQFCSKSELFDLPFCISILKFSRTRILRHSLDFSAFCIIQEYFSETFKISINWRGRTKFLGGNQFCRTAELFGSRLCISISKVLWTNVFRHSLDLYAFCMIQEYFSQSLKISTNQRGGTQFLGGTNSAEVLNYLITPSVFQF